MPTLDFFREITSGYALVTLSARGRGNGVAVVFSDVTLTSSRSGSLDVGAAVFTYLEQASKSLSRVWCQYAMG